MGSKKVGYDSIADVGPIALAIVKNPAQDDALKWLNKVLKGEIRCVIPLTTIIGAYIVAVRYLRAHPSEVADRLELITGTGKVLWFSDISVERVKRSMKIAKLYSIDSWDAYLISIMKDLGLKTVYTTDISDFSKVPGIEIVNPISPEKFHKLQEWLRSNIR